MGMSTAAAPSRTVQLPLQRREASFLPATVKAEERTVELVWTTGAEVERYDWWSGQRYTEALSLEPSAVDLSRLNRGAPFLNSHSSWSLRDVIGVVEKAWIEAGEGRAVVRFSQRADVEPIWQDVQAGILRNISVGYEVQVYEEHFDEGKLKRRTAVRWTPAELSLVPIPADAGAQVRSKPKDVPLFKVELIRRGQPAAPAKPSPDRAKEPSMKIRMTSDEKISTITEILGDASYDLATEEGRKAAAMAIVLKLQDDKPAEEAKEEPAADAAEMAAVVEAARKATGVKELRSLPVALEVLAESVKTRASKETAEKRAQRQREVDQAIADLELQPHRRDWALDLSEADWQGFRQRSAPIVDARPVETPGPKSAKPAPASSDPKSVINDQMRAYCQRQGLDLDTYARNYAEAYPGEPFVDALSR
jgi:hypothetical protein